MKKALFLLFLFVICSITLQTISDQEDKAFYEYCLSDPSYEFCWEK